MDCGGALCPLCAPGRTCATSADCNAALGNASGTALAPGAPGVECNPAALLCQDVRASPAAWSAAVAVPSIEAFVLRLEGLRSFGFTARVFRALQASVAASLASATPPISIAAASVLSMRVAAAASAGSRRRLQWRRHGADALVSAQAASVSNATDVLVWLLLPAGTNGDAAAAALNASGSQLAAAAYASEAVAPTYAVVTAGSAASSLSAVGSVGPSLPPFPLASSAAASSGGGASVLAPWAVAVVTVVCVLACCGLLAILSLCALRRRRDAARKATPVVLGAVPARGAQTAWAIEAAGGAAAVRFAYESPLGRGGRTPADAPPRATIRPSPKPVQPSVAPAVVAGDGLYVNPITRQPGSGRGGGPVVVRQNGGGDAGAAPPPRPDASGMFGNPMLAPPAAAPAATSPGGPVSPHVLLAGYRTSRVPATPQAAATAAVARTPHPPPGPPRPPHSAADAAPVVPDADGMYSNPIVRGGGGSGGGVNPATPLQVRASPSVSAAATAAAAATTLPDADGMYSNPALRPPGVGAAAAATRSLPAASGPDASGLYSNPIVLKQSGAAGAPTPRASGAPSGLVRSLSSRKAFSLAAAAGALPAAGAGAASSPSAFVGAATSLVTPAASDASSGGPPCGRTLGGGLTRLTSTRMRDAADSSIVAPSIGGGGGAASNPAGSTALSPTSAASAAASGEAATHRSRAFFSNAHIAKRMQAHASFRVTAFDAQKKTTAPRPAAAPGAASDRQASGASSEG